MKYQFTLGNFKPTSYGVERLYNTFKKKGRPYQMTIISKRPPFNLIDREIIILTNTEPPIVLPSKRVFDKCFTEIIPNYMTYGQGK